MASRDSPPLLLCLLGSLAVHGTIVLPLLVAALADEGIASMLTSANDPRRNEPTEPDRARAKADLDEKKPLPPRVQRPTEAERITLGIDEGADQPLVTWIGYEEYQQHLARLSEVEQAAMRLTPEAGGEPAIAPLGAMSVASPASPAAPPASVPAAITRIEQTADTGLRPSMPPAAPPVNTPPNAPPQRGRVTRADLASRLPDPPPDATPAARDPREEPAPPPPAPAPGLEIPRPAESPIAPEGAPLPPEPAKEQPPILDPVVRPVAGTGANEDAAPPRAEEEQSPPRKEDPAPVPEVPPVPAAPDTTESAEKAAEPSPPASRPQPFPTPLPENSESVPEHDDPRWQGPPAPPLAPGATPQPSGGEAAPSRPAPAPGPPVTGELTDREADPTSTIDVPSEQWRNGRPLAARGLQILTRRPELLPEYLAVQRAPVRHPVFEISFDNRGVVRKVVMLESSGAMELDDRLIDCLYRWRARGERLASVRPGDRLRLTMRMLVR